ncbi:hypothetical protein GLOIN_2v1720566 [Rhizophagus irregularis DAOM 181602=DAOM 197198]|uniref:Uncharacterized protein n=1 Tax=Rhizophagus irregularis (strain DAOM 181602 / DAOM 197198 / MUCL 43194) TaxID=747089 RepID=A0A2P4P2N5_RHIID|nr:hypothetical protein GLOIN_2v1720566 [Rhizophagus irregularis DAOM 181602=DAOM 197198]POG59651.1 hypothetical protein GLOIN_2v1720566 [Rhizophagus irregularis DAOM 181602=DAOM 197198]|eukprot:XP_025166517.1 hypothetical protein GLOIN_2v1720566 [Rhizophagus irregularis DAOM 181602=DAOM 197198]
MFTMLSVYNDLLVLFKKNQKILFIQYLSHILYLLLEKKIYTIHTHLMYYTNLLLLLEKN